MQYDIFIHVLLWIGMLLILGPIFVVLFVYKLLVIGIARVFYPCLSPVYFKDIPVTIDSSANAPNVNTSQVWFLDGKLCVKKFRHHFHECFLDTKENRLNYKNLYCYIVTFMGHQFKSSVEDICLETHIKEYSLTPGESLESFVGKWMVTDTFGEKMPLWQVLLVEHFDNTVILFKMHHSLVDGYSFVHIVEKLSRQNAPNMVNNQSESFWESVKIIAKAPKTILDMWIHMAFSKGAQNPFKYDRNIPEEWFISFSSLDLDVIKGIRQRTKTHFVSVMMSIQLGALRKLLLENISEKDLPEYLWIANSLPWPKHPKATLCNHWTAGFFLCPLRTSNPLKRLEQIEASYLNFVSRDVHKAGLMVQMPLFWLLPSRLIRTLQKYDLALINSTLTFASLVCSNEKHVLLGKAVKNLYLPVIIKDITPHCAMYAVTNTFQGRLELSVNASSRLISSHDSLNRLTQTYFPQEAILLHKLTLQ